MILLYFSSGCGIIIYLILDKYRQVCDIVKIWIKNVRALVPCADRLAVQTCSIVTNGDTIVSLDGTGAEGSDRVIDGKNLFAIPGLVNAHTHAYMTLFRNSADDLPFMQWLFDRIMPMEARLRPGDCYWTTLLGIYEMLRSGTTTFLDMFMIPDDTARAVADSGIRAVLSRGLQGETADDAGGMRRLREAKQDILAYSGTADGRITFMLSPHAPYTCAPAYLETVIREAEDLGVGIHTHLAESVSEIETIREKYGCTPIELMEKVGLFKRHTAAAHCVQLTPNDIRILRDNDVSVLTNPSSNLKLGNGFAPVPELLEAGINVALGTDSAASNNTLNMFHEMNMLALVHKGTHTDAVTVTSTEAVTAATLGGAKALDLPVGSLSVGKKADITLLDLSCPQLNPPSNLIASLAFSANGSEVDTVIVNGRILLEKRRLTTIDEERVIFESNRIFERVKN